MNSEKTALLIVMGASGVGKSTLGESLASTLGWRFVDADSFHSKSSIDKMRAGLALGEQDREPWLDRMIAHFEHQKEPAVLAWSGLLLAHRERFRSLEFQVRFVHLEGNADLLKNRLKQRAQHFMPSSQVENQLDTLEATAGEPDVLHLSASEPTLQQNIRTQRWLNQSL